jgi:hypothetical protein
MASAITWIQALYNGNNRSEREMEIYLGQINWVKIYFYFMTPGFEGTPQCIL